MKSKISFFKMINDSLYKLVKSYKLCLAYYISLNFVLFLMISDLFDQEVYHDCFLTMDFHHYRFCPES
jgi:hypothetical protein